jgi:hypothetical protein
VLSFEASGLENWLERWKWPILSLLTLLYLGGNIAASYSKPLWLDEFITLDLARLPTASQEWHALMTGADHTPPLFQLATRAAVKLAGENRIALRLPALLGFWTMCLCLFLFIRRHLGIIAGITAFLVPMLTRAEDWGFEARGYGLMFGFCGLAMLTWQRRWVWCFPLFMGAATICHPYSVFVLLAFAAGEAVLVCPKWRMDWRRLDWKMLVAFVASLIPIAIFSRILVEARDLNKTGLQIANLSSLKNVYSEMFDPFWTCATMMVAIALLVMFLNPSRESKNVTGLSKIPDQELAMGIAFLLLPLPIVGATIAIHGYFSFRYAAVSVIGVSLVLVFMIASSHRYGRLLMPAAMLVLLAFCTKIGLGRLYHLRAPTPPPAFESVNRSALPVYVHDPYLYMDLANRWPARLLTRLRFVADPDLSNKYKSAATFDYMFIYIGGTTESFYFSIHRPDLAG